MQKNLLFLITPVSHIKNNGDKQIWSQVGFYSAVLSFLKVIVSPFQDRLEKYLLTFGKNEFLCYKSYKHCDS